MVTLNRPVSGGRAGAKIDTEADERVARLFNSGMSIQDIARSEGLSWPSIQRRLKRLEREQREREQRAAEAQV